MHGYTDYMSSIALARVKARLGKDFYGAFYQWSFSTQSSNLRRGSGPCIIGSGTDRASSWMFNYEKPAAKLYAASTSINDNIDKTHAGTVYIEGVDKFYRKVSEFLNMSGQAATDLTAFEYRAVNKFLVSGFAKDYSVSIGYSNEGVIDLGTGSVSGGSILNPYATIDAGMGAAYPRQYTVHNEETVYITSVNATVSNQSVGLWSMWVAISDTFEGEHGGNVSPVGGYHSSVENDAQTMPIRVCSVAFNGNETNIVFNEPYEVPPKSTIYFTVDDIGIMGTLNIFAQGFKLNHKIEKLLRDKKGGRRESNEHRMSRLTRPKLNKPDFYLQKKNLNRK